MAHQDFAPLAVLAALLVVIALVALAFRRDWRLGTAVLLLILGLAALNAFLTVRYRATAPIVFTTPAFTCNCYSPDDAKIRVEEKHHDHEGHFVLHAPKGTKTYITPAFGIEVEDHTPFPGVGNRHWSCYLPLTWDGKRLTLENGTTRPSE